MDGHLLVLPAMYACLWFKRGSVVCAAESSVQRCPYYGTMVLQATCSDQAMSHITLYACQESSLGCKFSFHST